jgi:hypothetical protein
MNILLAGVEPTPLVLRPFIGLFYLPWMINDYGCVATDGIND